MSRMLQIRDVPDSLHRRLVAQAAAAGMSLSDFLKAELARIAGQLSPDELAERLAVLEPARVAERPVDALRAEREGR